MIVYSQEFVDKCKAAFPNEIDLHGALDAGSELVGFYLKEKPEAISNDDILNAKTLEELQGRAAFIKLKAELYQEWCGFKEPPKVREAGYLNY